MKGYRSFLGNTQLVTLGTMECSELEEEDCPALMSNKAMKDLKIAMDFETDTMSVKAAGVFDQPMHYTSSGHPALKLDKFRTDTSFPDEFLTYQADEEPTTPHFGKPSAFGDFAFSRGSERST